MTTGNGGNGLTSSDLWRWALGGLVAVVLSGGTIAINQWASTQTATTNRIEAKQTTLDTRVSGMAEQQAGFQAEVRVRLDRIEDGLGVGVTGSDGLSQTDGPVAGMATLEGVIGRDAP